MAASRKNWEALARQVLAGEPISKGEARGVLTSSDQELLSVLQAAFLVRHHHFGRTVRVHVLRNARSGRCPEDCSFCSQSAHYQTGVPEYELESPEEILEGARAAHRLGAMTYCIVTATRGPSKKDLSVICEAVRRIKAELPLSICTSLGLLQPEQARTLAAAGVDRYNHNLESSAAFFSELCTSHGWDDRVATIQAVKQAGMEACCGGILGLGEGLDDRVELAFALRSLQVESVPVNFLDPRPGTPAATRPHLCPRDCLRALAMFRLVHPSCDLRMAGGREACLGSLQALGLFAANSLFTRGYLTTGGQEPHQDWRMIHEAGFEVVAEAS